MYFVNVAQDVANERQLELLEYLMISADKVSISRYYNGYIEENVFDKMQTDYQAKLVERSNKRRVDYSQNVGGYKTRMNKRLKTSDRVMSYFDDLDKQEAEMHAFVGFDRGHEVIDNPKIDGFISSHFTRMTPVTEGPVQQMIFIDKDAAKKHIILGLSDLYDFPYIIDGMGFEDLMLYKDNEVVLAICSHEKIANMYLNEVEAKELIDLKFIQKGDLLKV